jgi:AraC-like DNA-binding protein
MLILSDMQHRLRTREHIKLWNSPGLPGLELLHATYVHQTFPRHAHDGFAVGVIESGALGFYYRGENVVAGPGTINLANPGEVHTGQAQAESGWTYRMFYMPAEVLQSAADEMACGHTDFPFFEKGVIRDRHLAGEIRALHMALEKDGLPRLEKQARFLDMLTSLIARHADAPPTEQGVASTAREIGRVRDYITACYADDITLDRLASVACLSPFHFAREFKKSVGLPPHTFLIQTRVKKAREMIAAGAKLAEAACAAGFTDQSHLTRHFKRITGVTPGQYSKSVQDG